MEWAYNRFVARTTGYGLSQAVPNDVQIELSPISETDAMRVIRSKKYLEAMERMKLWAADSIFKCFGTNSSTWIRSANVNRTFCEYRLSGTYQTLYLATSRKFT